MHAWGVRTVVTLLVVLLLAMVFELLLVHVLLLLMVMLLLLVLVRKVGECVLLHSVIAVRVVQACALLHPVVAFECVLCECVRLLVVMTHVLVGIGEAVLLLSSVVSVVIAVQESSVQGRLGDVVEWVVQMWLRGGAFVGVSVGVRVCHGARWASVSEHRMRAALV